MNWRGAVVAVVAVEGGGEEGEEVVVGVMVMVKRRRRDDEEEEEEAALARFSLVSCMLDGRMRMDLDPQAQRREKRGKEWWQRVGERDGDHPVRLPVVPFVCPRTALLLLTIQSTP